MKKFEAKLTRDEVEVKYIILADSKEEAVKKLFKISGERLKVKEI